MRVEGGSWDPFIYSLIVRFKKEKYSLALRKFTNNIELFWCCFILSFVWYKNLEFTVYLKYWFCCYQVEQEIGNKGFLKKIEKIGTFFLLNKGIEFLPQTVIFNPSISARPLIFQTLYSVRLKFLSLKYQKCILFLGSKDIRIRKFEFVTKTQFLWIWTNHLYLSVLSTQSLRAKNERPTFRNPIEKVYNILLEYINICK